jgi:hypothetical protein
MKAVTLLEKRVLVVAPLDTSIYALQFLPGVVTTTRGGGDAIGWIGYIKYLSYQPVSKRTSLLPLLRYDSKCDHDGGTITNSVAGQQDCLVA